MSWDRVFKDVGISQKVISDRGPQFVSRFMKELCYQLGVERNPSTAYHPQTNGQTERVNQEPKQYLRLYYNYRQNDGAEWLSIAEFSYNNRIHSSTGRLCKGNRSGRLQEIPQLIIVNEILLQPTSRRFLRELDEAPGGNNLHYILQCLHVPASVTRV